MEPQEAIQNMIQQSEGERRFREFADRTPILMWRADKTSACEWVNRAWREFTGRDLEQELGWGRAEGIHPEDREACLQEYRDFFSRGEPFSLTYRLRRADGVYRWVFDNAQPLVDQDGRLVGCFGSCTDVDDMVKANEALSKAVKERAVAVAQRDHLLREVQHRVRNNLQLILSIIDMQARADPSSKPALTLVAGRVRSIAKAQALLLDPTGDAQIDLAEYASSISQGVRSKPPIAFEAPAVPILLPLARAVPLGLMLNELLATGIGANGDNEVRLVLSSVAGATRIDIETPQNAQASPWADEPSKLVQRLSIQAGAQLQLFPDAPHKLVLHIDSPG